jgi:predicted AlkP superfamily pyrophosphatase or phosphodiesterase
MKKSLPLFFLFSCLFTVAQKKPASPSFKLERPKLVVGVVIDQMRWDFLYRYYGRYQANGGFKRLLAEGFSCENTFIPYTPTVTACGHTCIYTGSVPAIHGITGNNWWERELNRMVYCTEDGTVKSVGSSDELGKMSPRNMLTTTICDELRLATNFRSKVIGVAIKDRGGILPAGHSANAAYWYDNKSGDWISSTYYMNELPQWVKDFNAKKMVDKYYEQGWSTLYPSANYPQSTADEKDYESRPFGSDQKSFPYDLKKFIGNNYAAVAATPFGNSLTADMARAAVDAEQLGADSVTDFLAVSFSSTDYVGHSFGPNSIEIADTYLRLDRDLGIFLDYLDKKIGKGNYLFFLSADHGVAHIPGFMKENKLPSGILKEPELQKDLNTLLKDKTGYDKLVLNISNYQVFLDHRVIDSAKLNKEELTGFVVNYLSHVEGIARVFNLDELGEVTLNTKVKEMVNNGYYPRRSGDIQMIFQPQWIDAVGNTGTTHGLWNPYDTHIPLLFYGWNIKPGKTNRETYMTDIAATVAALLHIQMPNGCVGKVITEVVQ